MIMSSAKRELAQENHLLVNFLSSVMLYDSCMKKVPAVVRASVAKQPAISSSSVDVIARMMIDIGQMNPVPT